MQEMDRVRQFLNQCDLDIVACWASFAAEDRRCSGQFDFEQQISTVRITASQAKTCVGNICEEHAIGLRRSAAWGFGQDRTPSGMPGVSVMLTRPEALRKLEDAVEAEMEKGGDIPRPLPTVSNRRPRHVPLHDRGAQPPHGSRGKTRRRAGIPLRPVQRAARHRGVPAPLQPWPVHQQTSWHW